MRVLACATGFDKALKVLSAALAAQCRAHSLHGPGPRCMPPSITSMQKFREGSPLLPGSAEGLGPQGI